MMSIKAVIFDYGGVISFPPPHETGLELGRLTGLSPDSLRDLSRKKRGEWDRGTYNGIEYYRNMLISSGIFLDDESLTQIAQVDIDGWKHINQSTVKLMREIKSLGLTMGILSNMPRDFLDWAKIHIPIFSEAAIAIFSCDYGIIKPEEGIFNLLRDKADCEFKEIAFFDDTPENVAAARELGIRGYTWEGAQPARELLAGIDSKLAVLC